MCRRRTWRRIWVALLLGGSLAIAIAGLVRPASTSIVVHAKTEGVRLRLDTNWAWQGRLAAEAVHLTRVNAIETGVFESFEAPRGDAWVRIGGADASLDGLDLGARSLVEVYLPDRRQVEFALTGGPLSGRVQVKGSPSIAAGRSEPMPVATHEGSLLVPEALVFRARAAAGLHLTTNGTATLRRLDVSELSFSREVPVGPGRRERRSLLLEGVLSFPEVGREVRLLEGHVVALEGVKGRVLTVVIGEMLEVVFEGTVGRARVGIDRPGRDVTPSLLEWGYHVYAGSVPLALLVALWGSLWALRAGPEGSEHSHS